MNHYRALRVSGGLNDIWLACAVISLPMMALSAILLGLIFYNRVNANGSILSDLQLSQVTNDDQNAYLVNFSSTRLITIASWTSSVAPLLPGFVMTLLSFPTARHFSESSQLRRVTSLPTPYQLSLYLGLLSGGMGSLWQWVKYKRWRQREEQASVVGTLVIGLATATLLGYVIDFLLSSKRSMMSLRSGVMAHQLLTLFKFLLLSIAGNDVLPWIGPMFFVSTILILKDLRKG